MPLTPEEVISKTFQPTRFAEGYNQDEVDDFLDEVVSTLRAMQQEVDDLEAKLRSCQVEVTDLRSKGPEHGVAAVPAQTPRLLKEDAETPAVAEAPEVQEAPAPAAAVAAPAALQQGPEGAAGAANMLALAQRLHDEHVRNGESQRDQMIAEARQQAEHLVSDAEETRTATLSTLELEREELQSSIDTLRRHENEYRNRMRSFLQAQLSDLESQRSVEPEGSQR